MDVQKRETTNDLPVLPFELIIEILSRVPSKPLVRLKCVCKSWYGLINTPNFIKLHVSQFLKANSNKTLILHADSSLYILHFQGPHCHATKLYYLEYFNLRQPDSRFVGSCNGLLCFLFASNLSLYQLSLYNPLTQFRKILPRFNSTIQFLAHNLRIHEVGFAYDSNSNDYKVLMCIKSENENICWEIVLYSCKTNAWEIIAKPPWGWNSVKFPGVVVSNSLHWVDCDLKQIRCFDLFTRRYFEIPLPNKVCPGYKPTLAVLRQQLCIVTYYFDIWILKEYGMEESWTRIFRCPAMEWNSLYNSTFLIRWGKDLSLICSEDGCKILVATPEGSSNFVCCDLKSHEVRKIEILGLPSKFSAILPWVPSLAASSD